MTLIEVLVGLALLGGLLAAVIIAKGRVTAQWTRAERRITAVRAAEELLTMWWSSRISAPAPKEGQIGGSAPLYWRTTILTNPDAARLGARVVRLEIREQAMETEHPPLCRVDLLVAESHHDQ